MSIWSSFSKLKPKPTMRSDSLKLTEENNDESEKKKIAEYSENEPRN